ncbi:MAG: AMP-binding protein [Burkholderiales bacterium]|nr:AMP-binding protein [Burkholderiales bacterium]
MRLDVSGWSVRLDEQTIARYRADGTWQDRTLADLLDRVCDAKPDQALVIDGTRVLTAAQLRVRARRLAGVLAGRGLKPGDVVSLQLPNWHEAILIDVACSYGGYVCNPIVPIYRDSEVSFILADGKSRILFVSEFFRGFDYAAMVGRLRPNLPDLLEVVFVRPSDRSLPSFDNLASEPASTRHARPDPNDVKLVMYTSGTTSRAKGVLHTHNTIDTEIRNFVAWLKLEQRDVILMPSTLCHITGYLYGIQLPISLGCPVVLMDTWDASSAADLIDRHRVTFTLGATPFLAEITRFARQNRRPLPTLRYFPTGGAPVPPEVIYDANRTFERCVSFRLYGSTEAPTVTLGVPDRRKEALGATTEGYVVGHDIRLVDAAGRTVPRGAEGEIVTRGPENCVGYTAPEHNHDAFDSDGYFHTGDLGRLTPEGCLVITGRMKDLIIRGGENLSPKEIEDALYAHPAIREAAVVAMPHPEAGGDRLCFRDAAPGRRLRLRADAPGDRRRRPGKAEMPGAVGDRGRPTVHGRRQDSQERPTRPDQREDGQRE